MANQCAVRTQKIKDLTHLTRVNRHNARSPEGIQANHDPQRIHQNIEHKGTDDPSASWKNIVGDNGGRKVRSDAVKAVEILCIHSPEDKDMIEGGSGKKSSDIDPQKWGDECYRWACKKFGSENILTAHTHVDETTPHTQIVIVPIDQETGRLNCKKYTGSPKLLSDMQTDFAEKVGKKFGLERGKEGSKARHVSNQEYHARVRGMEKVASRADKKIEPKKITESAEKHAEKANSTIGLKNNELAKAKAERSELIKMMNAHREECKREKKKREDAEMEKQEVIKAERERVRQMPLEQVMTACGFEPERTEGDEKIYETEKGKVSINTEKQVYSLDWDKGGKGAIDLAMTVRDLNFKDAIAWLKEQDPDKAIASARVKSYSIARSTEPVSKQQKMEHQIGRDDSKIDQGIQYLEKRGIDKKTSQRLIDMGKMWANKYGSLVFPHTDGGRNIVGATLRGTQSAYKGCVGSKHDGYWSICSKNTDDKKSATIVESPIDAISALLLGAKGLIVSCAGTVCPSIIKQQKEQIKCGFDRDSAGYDTYKKMQKELGVSRVSRLLPDEYRNDWNEMLMFRRGLLTPTADQLKGRTKNTPNTQHVDNTQQVDNTPKHGGDDERGIKV